MHVKRYVHVMHVTGPDSLVVRASASGSEGRGFAPRPLYTKGLKNGTGSSLADARNKRVVLGRYKNAGRYLLLVMLCYVAVKALQSLCCLFQNATLNKASYVDRKFLFMGSVNHLQNAKI